MIRRRRVSVALVALLSLFLVACHSSSASSSASATATQYLPTAASSASSSASASASTRPSITPATTLDGIKATGDFGAKPEVTIPTPWAINKTQSRTLVQGTGVEVTANSIIEINYWGADGYTGNVFDESFTKNEPISNPVNGFITGFQTGVIGQKVGSRVLIGITSTDGYDSNGGASTIGVEVGDSLVFVVDIVSASLTEPAGTAVTPAAGLPTVSDSIKSPVVTVPTTQTPPTSLVVQPLIKGSGKAVTATATIRVDYAEYGWSTGKVVKQTYGYSPLDGTLASAIPGWQTGLVGQTVGSRVLLVVPPAQAYPSGNPNSGVKVGETMVYVVDILFSYEAG